MSTDTHPGEPGHALVGDITGATVNAITTVQQANAVHRQIVNAVGRIFDLGKYLSEIKAGLKHGEWIPYVDANFEFSVRTAQYYIAKYATVAHLDRAEAVKALEDGRRPKAANSEPKAAKPAPKPEPKTVEAEVISKVTEPTSAPAKLSLSTAIGELIAEYGADAVFAKSRNQVVKALFAEAQKHGVSTLGEFERYIQQSDYDAAIKSIFSEILEVNPAAAASSAPAIEELRPFGDDLQRWANAKITMAQITEVRATCSSPN